MRTVLPTARRVRQAPSRADPAPRVSTLKATRSIAAAAISRFASMLDGLQREFLFDPEFEQIVRDDLQSGQHRNPNQRTGWFTTAFFHHPEELATEADEAGLIDVAVLGVEGPPALFVNLEDRWRHEPDRSLILDMARAVESEPALLGASPHLLVVGRTPA